jgi:aquaporin Z
MKSEAEEVSGAKRCKAALSSDLCSRLVTEFVGTFFLCFVCTTNSGELAGISAGAALMAVTFAGGHISGAHYNPAVTLAVVVRGAIEYTDALLYWIAQIAGAFLAGGFGYYLTANVVDDDDNYGSFVYPTLGDGTSLGQAYLAEILMTFALAYTVLNVATTKVQADNSCKVTPTIYPTPEIDLS